MAAAVPSKDIPTKIVPDAITGTVPVDVVAPSKPSRSSNNRALIIGAVVCAVFAVVMGIIGGEMYGIIQVLKETSVTSNNDWVSKSTGQMLHVVSTEALQTVTVFSSAFSDDWYRALMDLSITLPRGFKVTGKVVGHMRIGQNVVILLDTPLVPGVLVNGRETFIVTEFQVEKVLGDIVGGLSETDLYDEIKAATPEEVTVTGTTTYDEGLVKMMK